MNSQRAGGREEASDFDRGRTRRRRPEARGIQEDREEDLQGGEVSDGEHLCRGLVALGAALVGFHGSCGGLGGLLERPRAARHLSCGVAVAEQRPDRHRPSCSLQSLRQARDGDRVPAGLGKSIVQSQAASRTRPGRSPALPRTQGSWPRQRQRGRSAAPRGRPLAGGSAGVFRSGSAFSADETDLAGAPGRSFPRPAS